MDVPHLEEADADERHSVHQMRDISMNASTAQSIVHLQYNTQPEVGYLQKAYQDERLKPAARADSIPAGTTNLKHQVVSKELIASLSVAQLPFFNDCFFEPGIPRPWLRPVTVSGW